MAEPNLPGSAKSINGQACITPAGAVPAPAAVPVAASEQDGTIFYQSDSGKIVKLNPDGCLRHVTEKDEVSGSQQMENEELRKLKEDNCQLNGRLTDPKSENAQLKLKLRGAEREIASLNDDVNLLKEALKANHDAISDLETSKKEKETKILSLNNELKELRSEKNKKSTEELEKMKKDMEQAKRQLVWYQEQYNDFANQIQEYQLEVKSYKCQIEEKDRCLERKNALISLLQVASTSSLMPDISKETEKRLGGQNSASSKTIKVLGGQSSSLENRLVASERFMTPDGELLRKPEKAEMSESQQNGYDGKYDDLSHSGENKVEEEMDESSEQSQSNGQDSWPIVQSKESFAKNTSYIKIDYNKRKEDILKKLIKYICALLNSVGGKIFLNESKSKKTTIIKDRDKLMQSLEQRLVSIMGQSEYKDCISYFWDPELELSYVDVKKGKRIYTVNSGLKIPLARSVVDATHKDIVKIFLPLVVGKENPHYDYPDRRHAELSFGATVPFEEGETIQFKIVSKGTATLEELRKFFEKHLPNYVSAFANCRGGNIYFGIDDNGTVIGQVMGDDQKTEIENMINEIITKKDENKPCFRIWGEPSFTPKDGEHWSIEFLEVLCKSETGKRYVIRVHIRPFNGGMFLRPPLAFKIDETSGEIVEMEFNEWRNIYISVAGCSAGQ